MQAFKENDTTEARVAATYIPTVLQTLGADRDTMFANCFICYLLGDVLYNLDRDPLVGVITQDVYRSSFPAIHDLFTRPGTFEFYLALFRKIFADDTDIQFTIPGPGQLTITIEAETIEDFNILVRQIVDDAYVNSTLVTSDAQDPILGQGVKGIKTQSQIDGLIAEISMYGIVTVANLVTPV